MACRGCKQHESRCGCGINGKKPNQNVQQVQEPKQAQPNGREQYEKSAPNKKNNEE